MSTEATVTSDASSLSQLLDQGADRILIAEYLNRLPQAERFAEALALRGKRVGRLYQACGGGPTLRTEDFVAADVPDGQTVIYDGRNSLPLYSRFQKRVARMKDGDIVGYNHQSMAFITGPGFFMIRNAHDDADVPGEAYFDYTAEINAVPESWPALRSNDRGLSTLVYKNMKDYMRLVANEVFVGTAYKLGKSQEAYFILCRLPDGAH